MGISYTRQEAIFSVDHASTLHRVCLAVGNLRPATDEVSTVGGWPNHDRVLEIAQLRHATITLLAVVVWVVCNNGDQYQLLKKQCYWYSDIVMRVFENTYGFDVNRTKKYNKGRTWLGVPLYKEKKKHVAVVAVRFRKERERVQDERRDAAVRELEEAADARGMEKDREERQKMQAKIEELERTDQSVEIIALCELPSEMVTYLSRHEIVVQLRYWTVRWYGHDYGVFIARGISEQDGDDYVTTAECLRPSIYPMYLNEFPSSERNSAL
ncbi:hypothetical protein BU17DRAFT_66246 [Hysterangium stoloniferum]|nr:hypothetical protein BU17DRAFT_66246 [Hysterangium stoloniferum]